MVQATSTTDNEDLPCPTWPSTIEATAPSAKTEKQSTEDAQSTPAKDNIELRIAKRYFTPQVLMNNRSLEDVVLMPWMRTTGFSTSSPLVRIRRSNAIWRIPQVPTRHDHH